MIEARLYYHLSSIFTDRQIEIILKKNKGEKLTKTESEYYSRTIKKKLKAISNNDLHKACKQILSL